MVMNLDLPKKCSSLLLETIKKKFWFKLGTVLSINGSYPAIYYGIRCYCFEI